MTAEPARSAAPPYDSPLRQQRAEETRDRIVAAGCELLRGSSIRDWRAPHRCGRWPSGPA